MVRCRLSVDSVATPPARVILQSSGAASDDDGDNSGAVCIEAFVKAILDPRVSAALVIALGPAIAQMITDGINVHLAPVIASVASLKKDVAKVEAEHVGLASVVTGVASDVSRLTTQIKDLSTRLEDQEIYSRAHNIIIRGLPEGSRSYASVLREGQSSADAPAEDDVGGRDESLEARVLELCCSTLGVKVESRDIAVTHRLRRGKADAHRPVIVRFTSRRVREELLHAKKRLYDFCSGKAPAERIYVSEHLTAGVAKLFFEARKLAKDKKVHSVWTRNGLVNLKFTDNPTEKITIVRCLADLGRHCTI